VHPAAISPEVLLRQCVESRTRRSGPGGQHRNKVETAVILVHRPTGLAAEGSERRSQAENRSVALRRLRLALALGHRLPPDPTGPSPLWQSRVRGRQISVSPRHEDLPALIAAQLELRGAARLPAVEKAWLLDPARTQQEVRAAIVAMSVHGGSPGPVSREAVVGAYLRFVERRRPLAGLVAQDLAGWKVWDATPRYAAWVDAPDIPMWSRIAMLQYLRESPDPAAKPAIERPLRAR
jgi:hypothetical protein